MQYIHNHKLSVVMSGKIIKYNYKSTLKLKYWESYLGRKLKKHEFFLIKQAESENSMNNKIMDIYSSAKVNGLYVPQLTNLHGNCIFESLQYHGLCDNIEHFRCGLAYLLILFKDKKYFIPEQELSLEEIFNVSNNVETVFCKKTRRMYKYTFITMCLDLAKNCSWTRLNTQLIFLAMTVLFNIRISVLHNNGYISEIKTIENENTKTIYLGLIDETHYIPVAVKCGHPIEDICPKYLESIREFHAWAREMSIMLGRVEYEPGTFSPPKKENNSNRHNNNHNSHNSHNIQNQHRHIINKSNQSGLINGMSFDY